MLVNVIGFNLVSGKRKSDGQPYEFVDVHYTYDDSSHNFTGSRCNHEFWNREFFPILSSNGLGVYEISFRRAFNGNAVVDTLSKIDG